jgi:hypothetical protein
MNSPQNYKRLKLMPAGERAHRRPPRRPVLPLPVLRPRPA